MVKPIAAAAVFIALSAGPARAQQCLHGPDETPEEAARRKDALGVTRQINNAQANSPSATNGVYFQHHELATAPYVVKNRESSPLLKRMSFDPAGEIIPGWTLTLDVTRDGYWFMVKDVKDPCGFAFISTKAGLIYAAQHLR